MGSAIVSTVVDIIRTQATIEGPALIFEGREISYRTLDERSSRAGAGDARRRGRRRRSGGVPRQEPAGVLRAALRRGQARRGVHLRELAAVATRDRRTCRPMPRRPCCSSAPTSPTASRRSRPRLPGTRIIALDGHDRWARLRRLARRRTRPRTRVRRATDDDIALQLYTSGTTGTAEGRDAQQPQLLRDGPRRRRPCGASARA